MRSYIRLKTFSASAKVGFGMVSGAAVGLALMGLRPGSAGIVPKGDPEPSDQALSSTEDSFGGESVGLKLKSVQIFFRHGARTPLRHLPGIKEVNYDSRFILGNVPHAEIPYQVRELGSGRQCPKSELEEFYNTIQFEGGVYAGMLTRIGKDQTYILGKEIKNRYVEKLNFIGKQFSTKEISIRSTNVNRCISSLEGVIAGMYGENNISVPVTIPVQEKSNEFLYPNNRHCECLRKLQKQEGHKLHMSQYLNEIREKIFRHIGDEHKTEGHILDLMQWRDHIIARKTHGLPVPLWLEEMLVEIEEAAVHTLKSFVCGSSGQNTMQLTLTAGPVLGMIKKNMELTLSQDSMAKKLYLFSCHDSSLFPLLEALQINDNRWPPYCAYLCLELWEDNCGKNWVQLRYCDKEMTPAGLTSPLISYEQFSNLIRPYAVNFDEYRKKCQDLGCLNVQAKAEEKSAMVEIAKESSVKTEQNTGL